MRAALQHQKILALCSRSVLLLFSFSFFGQFQADSSPSSTAKRYTQTASTAGWLSLMAGHSPQSLRAMAKMALGRDASVNTWPKRPTTRCMAEHRAAKQKRCRKALKSKREGSGLSPASSGINYIWL